MVEAGLPGAANLSGADLRGTRVCGEAVRHEDFGVVERLGSTDLSGVSLTCARYDTATRWPAGFDPARAGAVLVK
jgi:hypothetical protein